MFALRSIAAQWKDRGASVRHIGTDDDGDQWAAADMHVGADPVRVTASDVRCQAKVSDAGPFDLLEQHGSLKKVHDELRKEESREPGSELCAQVSLQANIGLSGASANSVSSAVKTTSFLFEQLLGDLDALAKRNKNGGETYRQDLVESFHAHMTEALDRLTTEASKELNNELESVEDILSQGYEAYITQLRKLFKNDLNDQVTVWYRGLNYEAYVPKRKAGSAAPRSTVLTACYGMTCAPIVNLCLGALECLRIVLGRGRADSVANDYSALNDGEDDDDDAYGVNGGQGERGARHSSRRGYRVKPVLKDLTGVLRHGRLTLVLGPPGCGKTSFLRAVAGQLHSQKGVKAKVSGEVRYNWHLVEQLKRLSNWSTYVSQTDTHLPLLTVRETLTYAWKCRKSARNKDPKVREVLVRVLGEDGANRLRALSEVEVDFVLATLGLHNAADTIIGNETLKGVSGGEKRRVTLGEMLVTGANVVCLDEISTGLDSAATFDIVKYLSASAHFLGQMVLVSLLQPPPEVVDIFDDIVLLAEGNVIYHGPRESIQEYFLDLGYKCPARKDLGDFLQELPTPSGASFLMTDAERRELGLPAPPRRPPRTADEFGAAWKQSEQGRRILEEVAKEAQTQFEAEEASIAATSTDAPVKSFSWDDMPENSFWQEIPIVLSWAWRLKTANSSEVKARIFQNIFMGLIFGTLFFQVGFDEWYLKFMLMGQMPGFMLGSAIGSVPKLVQERAVMYKHTSARFYSGASFVVCQFLVQVPFSLFDAFVFGNLLYWMCGLAPDPYRYGMFMLLAMCFGTALIQMMRVFAYAVRDQSGALVAAVLSYLLFLVFSGQIATPQVIPPYLRWFYDLNPLAWVYKAMVINEFKASKYDQTPCIITMKIGGQSKSINVPQRCGDFFLENRQFSTDESLVWSTVWILLGYLVLFMGATLFCVTYMRFDRAYTDNEEQEKQAIQEEEEGEQRRLSALSDPTNNNGSDAHRATQRNAFGRSESLAVASKNLCFSDLWYTIRLPKKDDRNAPAFHDVDLLKGVSGWALPGRMTALMGSSGAGKTTLLDVLAFRKTTGIVTGHILVNSEPPDGVSFRRVVGYVEQFGVHAAQATVGESVLFSAMLRLPKSQQHKAQSFSMETMVLLELDSIAEELTLSLSVEENKRLTIGVELVANPSILFADEPTSGLDARAAAIVMRSIQNVARSGRTVICTIHQPSIAVFTMFDDLLLMRRGGSVVFFGELGDQAENLINYFEGIPGTKACPPGYNPATWMLEVIGAGTSDAASESAVDFAAVYRKSKLCASNRERLRVEFEIPETRDQPWLPSGQRGSPSLFSPMTGTTAQTLTSPLKQRLFKARSGSITGRSVMETAQSASAPPPTSTSALTQLNLLLVRCVKTYWRSPSFSFSRLVVIVLVGALIMCIFFQEKYDTAAGVQSRISSISFIIMLAGMYNCFTILPFTIERRALFYREVSSGMYSKLVSVLSDGLIEIPYVIAEAVLGINIVYWGVGLRDTTEAYSYYCLGFFLYVYILTCLGIFFAWLMPDALSAQLLATVSTNIFQLFAGVIVPHDKLPVYYQFLYYFSPQKYLLEATITTQFHRDNYTVCDPLGKVVTDAPPFVPRGIRDSIVGKVCTLHGGLISLDEIHHQSFTGVARTAEDYVYAGENAFLHGYSYDNIGLDIVVMLAWVFALRVLTGLSVVFIDHNRR